MRHVIIGLGGIGSHLVEPLCRFIALSQEQKQDRCVILVDGDAYEEKNRVRQKFETFGNKAEVTRQWLLPLFPELTIEARARFIDVENIHLFIKDGDHIFMSVDNHATRKLVSEHVETLENTLLISGGNELTDGNVQIFERYKGANILPPLTTFHPEIAEPTDQNPAELSCEELTQRPSGRQLIAVNFTIAALMLNAYTLRSMSPEIEQKKRQMPYIEKYFDLLTGNVRAVKPETRHWKP